jgi:hypothetical protein
MSIDPEHMTASEVAQLPRNEQGDVVCHEWDYGIAKVAVVWNEIEHYSITIWPKRGQLKTVTDQLKRWLPDLPPQRRLPN